MNTLNASTSFTPFQLHFGRFSRMIPPLSRLKDGFKAEVTADQVIQAIVTYIFEVQDNLLLAKSQQAMYANTSHDLEIAYKVRDCVLLLTFHCQREYMQQGDHRVAKFICRFNGPFTVIAANPSSSSYILELSDHLHIFPTFHSFLLCPFISNDDTQYSLKAHSQPRPIIMAKGTIEYFIKQIPDQWPRECSFQYLIRWQRYSPEHDSWLPDAEVEDLAVLNDFLVDNPLPKR